MKKIFALTLAALLLVSIFAGCSLSPQTSESQVNVPVVTDIDREAVVATVGDKTVTMGDYIDLFDSYASYYTSYGYDLYSDPAALEEFQDFVIDILVEEQVIAYQAGGCALTPGGGLYALEAPHGAAVLCAEGMADGRLLVKELLCDPSDLDWVLARLPGLLPGWSGLYRTPWGAEPFGMLKWLSPEREAAWDWSSRAYLGLAFD